MFRFCMLVVIIGTLWGTSLANADVILQIFECRWETIEHRMPDVFATGYRAFWLPPPGMGESGGYSVGYDCYDRFDLGRAGDETRYGTREWLASLIDHSHRARVNVYTDLIVNHNAYADHTTTGFEESGGYPGFATWLSEDEYGDFHDPSGSGRYYERVAGLIDIAQEKNHTYIRHPVATDSQNLPYEPIDNENYQFYPDLDLSPNADGVYPFNVDDPMAGDPYADNATGLLLRHIQWMVEVVGVDGFRVDAQKHVFEWFFDAFYDKHLYERGRTWFDGSATTPFSFGEVLDSDWDLLGGYIRKDGYGNRDVLDYSLYFSLCNNLNGTGYGQWGNVVGASIDMSDGYTDGSRGVQFVSNHDLDPPGASNLAYAFILTRPGYPIVYFNAKEMGSSWPKSGRGDALGGEYGELITTLVDIHNEYARGTYHQRWLGNDVLIYERENVMLVGLNDNAGTGSVYDERAVDTEFEPGTRLHELTGNAANSEVDPSDEIPDVITVGSDGRVTLRVPRNVLALGYVVYGPCNPDGTISAVPTNGVIPADDPEVSAKLRRTTEAPIITSDTFNLVLETTDADELDPNEDDNAMFIIDGGGDYNGNGQIDSLYGFAAGFEDFLSYASPLHGGGEGRYEQQIDATTLSDGYHYIKAIAFRHRDSGEPIWETFPLTVYVDRLPPQVELLAPTVTGDDDITRRYQTVVIERRDEATNSVHVIVDQALGTDVMPLVSESNRADRVAPGQFEYYWSGIDGGNHTLAIVAYEESGRVAVQWYVGINADNGWYGLGDVNRDGYVNFGDIDAFVEALASSEFDCAADIDGDGHVNFNDIDPFVECLTHGCP